MVSHTPKLNGKLIGFFVGSIEDSAFFQRVRSSLVTGIYNNPDIWPIFGFEGESASQGGYINRGFDDIDWLDQV